MQHEAPHKGRTEKKLYGVKIWTYKLSLNILPFLKILQYNGKVFELTDSATCEADTP